MRVIRKQHEHAERSDKAEAVSIGSWKEPSEELDDRNIQEERLVEANDTHWEVYDSAVTSQLALMMKTVTTTRMKYMKRRMCSRTKIYIFVRIERSGNMYINFRL